MRNGRFFTEADAEGSEPVCVIDDLLARQYWPDRDPVGEEIDAGGKKGRIIGVIGHVHQGDAGREDAKGEYLFPLYQQPVQDSGLAIRTAGDPLALAAGLREAIRAVDPAQSTYAVRTMQSRVDESFAPRRFAVTLLAGFAVFAVALAALGIYGLIGFSVSQRRPEIGLRVALGASPNQVLRMVMAQGVRIAVVGTAAGLVASTVLARLVRSQVFQGEPLDPVTFAGMSAVLLAVVLLASYLPAHRAASIDPADALRHE